MEKKNAARFFGGMIGKVYRNKRGQTRAIVVLAVALMVLAVCVPLAEWLYWSGFNALTRLWGVTERNIARAPWPIRQFARYSGVLLTLIQGGLLLALSRRLSKSKILGMKETPDRFTPGHCLRGFLTGAGSLLILWLALLALDNLRLGHSLLRPAWSANTLILPLTSALWAAATLTWGVSIIYRFLSSRLPWILAAAISTVLMMPLMLHSSQIDALLIVNLLLCGTLCCVSARENGGWDWGAGFLFAVWLLERAVLGFPGYSAALYETYPVNFYWLNGGERGLWHGAAMTLLLLVNGLILLRPLHGKSAS